MDDTDILGPDTFVQKYGDGPKSIENAIRKELLGGDYAFTALDNLIKLSNTLIVNSDPQAEYALKALQHVEKAVELLTEDIVLRYSLLNPLHPEPRKAYATVSDPSLFQRGEWVSHPLPESSLTPDDLEARYRTKDDEDSLSTEQLVYRAMRAEVLGAGDALDAYFALTELGFKLRTLSPDIANEAYRSRDDLNGLANSLRHRVYWTYNIGGIRTKGIRLPYYGE